MGYTHYWYRRETEVDVKTFRAILDDFRKLVPIFTEIGIPLADGWGQGEAEIGIDGVWFNGVEKCGHVAQDLGITWPSPTAAGVDSNGPTNGHWFAGALLETRTCGGDCSHETLHFPRVLGKDAQFKASNDSDWFFFCCKTAYKPYDVAVTAFLVVAKHHLADKLRVSSDGEARDWKDAQMICSTVLGYPQEVTFDAEEGRMQLA